MQYIVYWFNFPKESMLATMHSVFRTLKSGLLLTDQPNFQNGRTKVKDGIISGTKFSV